jgi:hypothetical protein
MLETNLEVTANDEDIDSIPTLYLTRFGHRGINRT